jgi:hypothetical protein
MRKILSALTCVASLLSASAPAQDRGLALTADALGGAQWQTRFEHDSLPTLDQGRSLWLPPTQAQPQPQALRLLGDYQFNRLRLGNTGGLRLTGGLLVNLRAASTPTLLVVDDSTALPYAGIGWAGGSPQGAWGFSADLGLAAQGLGSLRLDRLFNGGTGLSVDGAPRLLPMVRLGMNLAF